MEPGARPVPKAGGARRGRACGASPQRRAPQGHRRRAAALIGRAATPKSRRRGWHAMPGLRDPGISPFPLVELRLGSRADPATGRTTHEPSVGRRPALRAEAVRLDPVGCRGSRRGGDRRRSAGRLPPSCRRTPRSSWSPSICAGSLRSTQVFVCSGNHDLDVEGPGGERIAGWLAGLGVSGVVRDGQALAIGETLFSCFPWWEGAETREAIAAQMARDAARRTGTVDLGPSRAAARQPSQLGREAVLRGPGAERLDRGVLPDAGAVGPRASGAVRVRGGWVDRIDEHMGLQHGPAAGRSADARHHRH